MHLKRLELVGFKSFASKTVLEFPAGIVGVVGPNGSGKSNIIDAIRWLLGEREAKNMRGMKAEDLIFAGTPERPRMGMAAATIVFDNTTHFFPVDYEEVAIRRRVERDGTSMYYLNDAEVRLKDVIDFFAQSRLGTKGFSIINQGESDAFIRASAKERRAMLEEILGLRQYQLKKHEAELKLRGTRQNMETARAHLEELMPHLRFLRRQAMKWEKRGELETELEELERAYFSFKIAELDAAGTGIEPKRKELDGTIASEQKKLAAIESQLAKVEAAQPKRDDSRREQQQKREELSARHAKLQRELGRVEAQLELAIQHPSTGGGDAVAAVALLEEAQELLRDLIEESDVRVVHNVLQSLLDSITEFFETTHTESSSVPLLEHSELENLRGQLARELESIVAESGAVAKATDERDEALEKFNEQFKSAFAAVEQQRKSLMEQISARDRLRFDAERIDIKRQELAHTAAQAERKLGEFSMEHAPKTLDTDATERRMLSLRGQLAAIGEVDTSLLKDAKETEDRYGFISKQLEDLTKAHEDLTRLIRELDEKVHTGFERALRDINDEFQKYFRMMFSGGKARLSLVKPEEPAVVTGDGEVGVGEEAADTSHAADHGGLDISVSIPGKRISGLEVLSGGEKTLVSIAVLFALISVSPPPFLVLDEVDAPLDEVNTRRFATLVKEFGKKTQFILVTHNRATMETADILYGVTMDEDGTSKVLSLKLE